ncbi:denn (aex-3) domain-containing protein [Anaeramoeba flamelloides]|uniref:Denn (Aex-3) domain-containing protein n=1 Tax=Anaeramoeba flamelloides TaxID=1746091 RepID=A0ABQ8XND2_9EUKA|nr:denn (aex-3) domain-containing protein [Anaeramoeba flamelloides]
MVIVFLSNSLRVLSCAPFAIFPLISPLKWQGAIIPIIPTSMMSFIDSPVPVMLGITKWANTDEQFTSDYLLVNLDKNKVNYIQNSFSSSIDSNNTNSTSTNACPNKLNNKKHKFKIKKVKKEFPKLPSYNELYHSIKEVFTKANKNCTTFLNSKKRGANAIKILKSTKRSSYFLNNKELKTIAEIQAIFAKYYNLLFTSFRNHTFTDVSSKDTCSIFLTESFLESIIPKDKPFMDELLKTQSFYQFSNDQLEKIQRSLSKKIHNTNYITKAKTVTIGSKKLNSNYDKFCKLQFIYTQNDKIKLFINFDFDQTKKTTKNYIPEIQNQNTISSKKNQNFTNGKINSNEDKIILFENTSSDTSETEQLGMANSKSLPTIMKNNQGLFNKDLNNISSHSLI